KCFDENYPLCMEENLEKEGLRRADRCLGTVSIKQLSLPITILAIQFKTMQRKVFWPEKYIIKIKINILEEIEINVLEKHNENEYSTSIGTVRLSGVILVKSDNTIEMNMTFFAGIIDENNCQNATPTSASPSSGIMTAAAVFRKPNNSNK
ncbi:hypothetical protein L9F63_008873, partial [Diploptera punctata]